MQRIVLQIGRSIDCGLRSSLGHLACRSGQASELGKTYRHVRKVTRAYHLEMEGCGEEKKSDRVPDTNVQERNKI